jgi:formyltetrahydrofolate synthetase
MTMRMIPLATAGMLLAAASPAATQAEPEKPAVRACLPIANIRGTNVVDRQTIDFTLRDRSVWRSRLPFQCPQLGFERAFSYQTAMSQLCKQDVITVIQVNAGRQLGARCGLGEFVRQPPAPPRAKRKIGA